MRHHEEPMSYKDAKNVCREKGAFLINLSQFQLMDTIMRDSQLHQQVFGSFVGTGKSIVELLVN